MANEPKSHRGFLDIIGEKEAELSKFRHATEKAIEEEEHRDHQQYLQLRSDFEHNLNLLFQKDELIQILQTQLMQKKNQYEIFLKDSEEQNEKIVKEKIGHIQGALEEEWHMYARRNEEEQRKRLEVEYEGKLSRRQKTLYAEHQDFMLNKLRNQEKELWISFDKITKEKESWFEQQEKDLRDKLITKERENASIIATVEGKWGEKESDLSQKIAAEFELKIYNVRQVTKNAQKESENTIAKLTEEQRHLIRKNSCFNHDIQELHNVNDELNMKVRDLLGVIESTERGFVTKVQHFRETEASTRNDVQLKCDRIISLQTEINRQSVHHKESTIQLRNKWSNEKIKFHDNITALKKELKDFRVEMKRIQASEENTKYLEGEKKNEIDSLNKYCSELKSNLKCVQVKLNLNIESMSVLQRENSDLKCCVSESSTRVQQKEVIICQLKNQIFEDRRSLEEKQHQLAKERDTILSEKEGCMKTIVALRNELESLELKLFQTREASEKSPLAASQKLDDLTYSLQQSQLENNKLKETVTLMRKEMESVALRPGKSPTHTTPRSSFLIDSDNNLKSQLENLRSQLNQILDRGKSETKNDYNDSFNHKIEDFSIFKNSLQELNSIVECLKNENMRHMHISQTCANLTDTEDDTKIQIFELSNELNAVILERNSLLELSNKLRSDVYKLNSSTPTLGLKMQTGEELRQKTDLSNPISTHSSSDEVDSVELAKSLWTRVIGAKDSNAKKFPLRASDRATASQRMLDLRLRTEERGTEKKYKTHSKDMKVRNWCYKDD